MIFLSFLSSNHSSTYIFFSFSYLIEWFFHEYLGFLFFFFLSSSYQHLVCHSFIATLYLLSTYYNVVLFVVLLLTLYLSEDDSGKIDLIC